MQLLVGLGNPGDQYRNNRHNIGFMAVDAIARRHGFPPFRKKFNGLVSEATIAGEKVLILKPQTFMNLSGNSVAQALNFYKLEPEAVTVLYDEIDLAPGKVRVKRGGGNGGHNGLRSIDPQIGTNYRRVRLGIGHPGHKDRVPGHVLADFHKSDAEWLDPLLKAIGDNADLLVKGDDNGFMNKLAIAVGSEGTERSQRSTQQEQGQSHAPPRTEPRTRLPETGPMAAMLKKLFGDKNG